MAATGEPKKSGGGSFPPVWRLLRGEEVSDAETKQVLIGGAVVLLVLAVALPGLFALVQLGVFGAALVWWLLGVGRGQPEGLAGWWYRPVTFPWLELIVLGVLSIPFAVAAYVFGRIWSLPGAAASVFGVGLVARWIAYRRRLRARRAVVDQPDTAERQAALALLRDDPAAFMRTQAAAAGHGVYLGTAGDRWVFSEAEHAVLVLGPPRSGKTSAIVVPTILSANGALLCTSTKTDVLADTIATRATLGTCWLFDPTASVAVPEGAKPTGRTIDANAVVSYNIRAIRERRGWTQEQVAVRLGRITGHQLPQASISAMERGVDGSRRRRFDAHELYLLALVFDVPIVYFFMPPPQHGEMVRMADSNYVAVHLYALLLGHSRQLSDVDERLRSVDIVDPETTPGVLTSLFGYTSGAKTWAGQYREWREDRLHQLAGDPAEILRQVAGFLKCLSREVAADGREACLAQLEGGGSV